MSSLFLVQLFDYFPQKKPPKNPTQQQQKQHNIFWQEKDTISKLLKSSLSALLPVVARCLRFGGIQGVDVNVSHLHSPQADDFFIKGPSPGESTGKLRWIQWWQEANVAKLKDIGSQSGVSLLGLKWSQIVVASSPSREGLLLPSEWSLYVGVQCCSIAVQQPGSVLLWSLIIMNSELWSI